MLGNVIKSSEQKFSVDFAELYQNNNTVNGEGGGFVASYTLWRTNGYFACLKEMFLRAHIKGSLKFQLFPSHLTSFLAVDLFTTYSFNMRFTSAAVALSFAASVLAAATPAELLRRQGNCNTGSIQCCNSVQSVCLEFDRYTRPNLLTGMNFQLLYSPAPPASLSWPVSSALT